MESNAYEKLRMQTSAEPPKNDKKPEKKTKKPKEKLSKEDKLKAKAEKKERKEKEATKEYQRTVKETIKKTQKKREQEKKKTTGLESLKHMSAKSRKKTIIFLIVIGYIIFLIYGVVNSDFVTNDKGVTVPVPKSNKEVKETEEFKVVKSYYLRAQNQYKKILDIDIELSKNPESTKLLATKYEKELSFFDAFITDLHTVDVGEEYSIVLDELVAWCSNDICVYLQNMSAALSTNNAEKASNALSDRGRTIVDFNTISDNLTAIGNEIRGVDTIEMNFDPEEYTRTGGESSEQKH